MPPRIRLRPLANLSELPTRPRVICLRCYATTVPSPPPSQITSNPIPIPQYDPRLPPSHRDPKYRKSQLIRAYVSLLQTTPLILLFQHNNLRAAEWVSIRRELYSVMRKVDDTLIAQATEGSTPHLIGDAIKLQVVRTSMLEASLRIVEYFDPKNPPAPSSTPEAGLDDIKHHPSLTHALSTAAYTAAKSHQHQHPLTPLLIGNIALLTFPTVSPVHLKAALSILSPIPGKFPAPTRRANPNYHEPHVQDGLKKLVLLGATVDGQIFDSEGVRWMGGIEGGIDGLRAQIVQILQMASVGVTQMLEAQGKSLWMTMESRRKDMEETEGGGKSEEVKAEEKA
jgi:large subunit ribosomal protein L10